MKIFIVHGWDGSPDGDWIPWVAAELKARGHEVHALAMPHPERPTIAEWVLALAGAVGTPDEQTFFIGHSIGCQTIMRYAETLTTTTGGAIFVAGWFTLTNLENEGAEKIAAPWMQTPINFKDVVATLPHITAVLSTDDQFVPLHENQKIFTKKLHAKIIQLPNAGHITADDGYTQLPKLLEEFDRLDNSQLLNFL